MSTTQPDKKLVSPKLPKSAEPSMSTQLLLAAIIILITFVVYRPAMSAGFIWDDDDMLTENEGVRGSLGDIWFEAKAPFLSTKFYDYIPLTLTSYWIEYRLWEKPGTQAHDMHPKPYHAMNILLHALTAIVFWRVLKRLKIPGAWIAGLIFAVHPVNVQSVAWVTERKNTLSLLFYALSLWAFVKSEITSNLRPETSNSGKWFWAALGFFVLGLLSKAAVIMLPVVLLGILWWTHGKLDRRSVVQTLPFFALSIVFAAITINFQYQHAISTDVVSTSDFPARMATAGRAVWFYAGKILWPAQLSFMYPRWEIDAKSVVSFLPGIAAIGAFGLFWFFRKTWGRPPLFGLGYFLVTLFPVLGFFNIYFQKYTLVADYWQYPSVIGIIALAVGLVGFMQKRFAPLAFLAIPVVALLGWQTSLQSKVYKNDEILFKDVLKKNPRSWMAHNTLGVELLQQERFDEALPHFQETLKIKPDHAMAHCNVGDVMTRRGDFRTAIAEFREAFKYDTNLIQAMQPLVWLEATHRNPSMRNGPEAVRVGEQAALVTNGENPIVLDALAAAYAETGQFDKAIETTKKAIEIAQSAGATGLVNDIRTRLREYMGRRPHRE
ncbi:MAG: Tetratricopeptide repeat protein [Verrucomicrobiales bacterium]|nr:Tetratricopeptide repeat protein [Verrucomicrobiales bacterium]